MSDVTNKSTTSARALVLSNHDAKATIKGMKNKHALHVLTLMETLGLSKGQAEVVAWYEGVDAYDKRMS